MSEPGPETTADDDLDWRCHRHPDRVAGVRCRRCQRPICPDCMITAAVGFQCPDCVRQQPAVRSVRAFRRASSPLVTMVLVAVNLALFVPSFGGDDLAPELGLFGPAVAAGDWYRLVTAGFVHANLMHVAFNCLLLWQLGTMLEPALGRTRFALLYFTALLAGSVGVLLLDPRALTVGASGAVFGLMGAAVAGLRRRGIDPMQTGLGGLLAINLVITFVVPGISIGGHVGGLVGGAAAGSLLFASEGTRESRLAGAVAVAVAGLALFAFGLWLADNPL